MNGGAIGGILCVLLIGLPIGLLIGAVILRGGVSFANKCLPKESERNDRYWDDEDDDEDYDRPVRRRAKAAIPEPGLGKAMGIVLVGAIVGFIISIPINLVMGVGMGMGNANGGNQDQTMRILASLIQLPIGFLVSAGIRTGMLPTSFGRACLVVVFEYLIMIVICVIIAVPLFLLGFLLAGR